MKETTVCAWCGGAKNRRARLLCFACRQNQKRGNLLGRFWEKVNAPDDGLCWLWLGRLDKDGYGRIATRPGHVTVVHRFSYELHHAREVSGDLLVCHSCDTPNCVNPAHLFIGTQLDNVRDCLAKGRGQRHNALKTHCKRGHEFTAGNIRPIGPNGQWRQCRECLRLSRMEASVA